MVAVMDERLQDFDFAFVLQGSKGDDAAEPYLAQVLALHYTNYGVGSLEAEVTLGKQHCRAAPFGAILHGGTSLAIAETVAGLGSMLICHAKGYRLTPVGVAVTGNHISMAALGEHLTIRATALQQGQRLHVWNVDLLHDDGKLVSSVRVTNALIPDGSKGKRGTAFTAA
ncbi:MAG TPA: PaaI family thioesterase [Candidatus Anaerobiospirillum stercoravium]|nr:PaaI family thioesterase [Candidatus Anaerobiospirillum stercoravium]